MKELYKHINILVIGDSCIDVFRYGQVPRIAPEGPAPVFNPIETKSNGGMALNVQANIEAIGAKVTLITQNENIVKTRYVDERTNSLLLRVDEEQQVFNIDLEIVKAIKDNHYNGEYYDAIIISDYCKGFLEEDDISFIGRNNKNVFLDTKKILDEWCKNVSYIKINETEYERTLHTIEKLNINKKLIITKSDKGCEFDGNIFPVEKVNIKDLSGAGDTFISGLAVEFARSNDIFNSIVFAQECATKVVQKKGVCTI
jgi:D-beta-D-heptose 7-phosphate kinase/D-beta-D-heptose 1-phosphate adenosyltransferase